MDKKHLQHLCWAAVDSVGQAELARQVGVTRQAVWKWRKIPDQHLTKVHQITGIPLHELRPDLYQPRPANADDLQKAYDAGRYAAANGIPLSGNPYALSQPRRAWATGWKEARG